MSPISPLLEKVARLRDPEGGCPWDREQTAESMSRFLLEEAAEALDAAEDGDTAMLVEELGDILLVVAMIARILEENEQIPFSSLVEGIVDKIVRRHPHVFGTAEAADADAVLKHWNEIKRGEEARPLFFEKVSRNLPPLELMHKLQADASRHGFDWPERGPVLEKVREEMAEFLEVLDEDQEKMEEEFGDILFSLVNLSRFLNIDPARAARRANQKFITRLKFIKQGAEADGRQFEDLSFAEMDALWDKAKGKAGDRG